MPLFISTFTLFVISTNAERSITSSSIPIVIPSKVEGSLLALHYFEIASLMNQRSLFPKGGSHFMYKMSKMTVYRNYNFSLYTSPQTRLFPFITLCTVPPILSSSAHLSPDRFFHLSLDSADSMNNYLSVSSLAGPSVHYSGTRGPVTGTSPGFVSYNIC